MARRNNSVVNIARTLVSWMSFNAAYKAFGLALVILGLSFYVSWSILYNTWIDPGLYSVTVILVVFGILSLLLAGEKAKETGKGR